MPKYLCQGSYTERGLAGLLKEGGSKRRAMVRGGERFCCPKPALDSAICGGVGGPTARVFSGCDSEQATVVWSLSLQSHCGPGSLDVVDVSRDWAPSVNKRKWGVYVRIVGRDPQ